MNTRIVNFTTALIIGAVASSSMAIQAQEKDVALAHIKYELTHIDDTNFRDEPRKEEMMVYIGKQSAMYSSYTLAKTLEELRKQLQESGQGSAAGQVSGSVRINSSTPIRSSSFMISSPNVSNETLYLFPQENKAFVTNRIGMSNYIIPQDYPHIDWQIQDETKEIGGYLCQKATGHFGGRNYTAWFSPDLPFPYGPWKLHGLPGLILEAEDSKGEVRFQYAGFDTKRGEESIEIALPTDATTTNAKDFAKAKAAFDKDPMGNAMRNLPPGAERKIVLKDKSGRELSMDEFNAMRETAMKDGKIKQPNNPLELENQ